MNGSKQKGFSLIELLVVMGIFSIIIVAASQTFINLLRSSKQQGKITATNIEGMLGLEVIRRDVAHAGYGLYWDSDTSSCGTTTGTSSPPYTEVDAGMDANGALLDDAPNGIPRAIAIGNGLGLNGSTRFAVKSVNVAANTDSDHYQYIAINPVKTVINWSPSSENISSGEYVTVVRPKPDLVLRTLICPAGSSTLFSAPVGSASSYSIDSTSIMYDLGTQAAPKMPFNRADYYVANTALPTRCAAGTGVLYKSVVSQVVGNNGFQTPLPLLDCVADMEVAYRYDDNLDGYVDSDANPSDASVSAGTVFPADALSARKIREVRIYILAQEGQRDDSYAVTYPSNQFLVGEMTSNGTAIHFGRQFDLTQITDYSHYRWKLYAFIVETVCLIDWTVNK